MIRELINEYLKLYPEEAEELFSAAERMAKLRYQAYVRKSQEDWSEVI